MTRDGYQGTGGPAPKNPPSGGSSGKRPCTVCGGKSFHHANCPDAGPETYALSSLSVPGVAQSAAFVGEDAGADRSGGHLSELLDRVNAATGPDRYIDALIHLHRRPKLATAVYSQPSIGRWVRMDGRPDIVVAPAYSESMDAVVDLLKQALPGVLWAIGSMEEGPFCRLVVPQADGGYIGGYVTCNAESPPLAILAALLTALIRKQQWPAASTSSSQKPNSYRTPQ